jgi:hypothetical protein
MYGQMRPFRVCGRSRSRTFTGVSSVPTTFESNTKLFNHQIARALRPLDFLERAPQIGGDSGTGQQLAGLPSPDAQDGPTKKNT